MSDYRSFLESKFKFSQFHGFDVAADEVNPALKPFTRLRAVKLGRRGRASELNPSYFRDGVRHLRAQDLELNAPTLFDFEDLEAA
jgi:hypothetical protein